MVSHGSSVILNDEVCRSKIQGLGLYAKRDIDMGAMIIEYKGELIRSEVRHFDFIFLWLFARL